jgi:hypothetical protein
MTIVEFTTTPLMASCRLVIDYLDILKNSKINRSSLNELKTSIHALGSTANSKLLLDFPIDIVDESIDDVRFEIGGPHLPELKFTEMRSFVIDTLEQAERLEDITLCLDALRVLINYGNIVVFSRTDHFLVIRQKKLDELQSSNELVETSAHVQNGDDSCIT